MFTYLLKHKLFSSVFDDT